MSIQYQIDKEQLKKIQAIFCDVDGTLINSKCQIDLYTKKEVQKLKDKIPFILTSGRTYKGLQPYHEELELNTPYITLNGSYIVDGDNVLESIFIDENQKNQILSFLLKYFSTSSINIFSGKKWISNRLDNIYMKREIDIVHFLPDQLFSNIDMVKNVIANKILFIGEDKDCDLVTNWGKKNFPDLFVIHNSPTYVEFFSKKSCKGNAIKTYCQLKGYDISNVLGAGDTMIDETMIQTCGLKATPMNAVEYISSLSNIHLPSNDEDAIGCLAHDILEEIK